MKLQPNTVLVFKSNPYEGTIYDLNCVMSDQHGKFKPIYVTGPPKITSKKGMIAYTKLNESDTFFAPQLYKLNPREVNNMDAFIDRVGMVYGLDMLKNIEEQCHYSLVITCPKCQELRKPWEFVVTDKEYGRSLEVTKLHVCCRSCYDTALNETLDAFHDLIEEEEG